MYIPLWITLKRYYSISKYTIYTSVSLPLLGLIIYRLVDYVVMIALCFFVLPFTYFYAEETLDGEEDMDFEFDDEDDDELNT